MTTDSVVSTQLEKLMFGFRIDRSFKIKASEYSHLWCEEVVSGKLFRSDAPAQAIIDIGMQDVFRLKECRIQGSGVSAMEDAA